MNCPFCHKEETKVIDSRLVDEGSQVRRRRQCLVCEERFTTFETIEWVLPRVIKRDGRRCAFDQEKLRISLLKALEKRPLATEGIEQAFKRIIQRIRASGERELPSSYIGSLVMEELKSLDAVAYVRFASVYRSFEDIGAFQLEINRLLNHDSE